MALSHFDGSSTQSNIKTPYCSGCLNHKGDLLFQRKNKQFKTCNACSERLNTVTRTIDRPPSEIRDPLRAQLAFERQRQREAVWWVQGAHHPLSQLRRWVYWLRRQGLIPDLGEDEEITTLMLPYSTSSNKTLQRTTAFPYYVVITWWETQCPFASAAWYPPWQR